MNSKQVKVFKALLEDENFKGKEQLRHLLWLNTSKPKYKVGDCVRITNYQHKVFGHQVIDFSGKIAEIYTFKHSNEWHYRLEMEVICGDKHTVINEYAMESEIEGKARNNVNKLYKESIGDILEELTEEI